MLRAMPRAASYSGSFEDMPLSVQRAATVPRDFYDEAMCRPGRSEVISLAWIADPNQSYRLGTQRVKGTVLNSWALTVCHICPVQWECASAAIAADERAGVWGDTLDNLRALRNAGIQPLDLRRSKVPVQDAVRALVNGIS